jgi:hypothetical protein
MYNQAMSYDPENPPFGGSDAWEAWSHDPEDLKLLGDLDEARRQAASETTDASAQIEVDSTGRTTFRGVRLTTDEDIRRTTWKFSDMKRMPPAGNEPVSDS